MIRPLLAGLALLCLAGCGGSNPSSTSVIPSLNVRENPDNVPGYVSPCAGGQPRMQYNCAQVFH